MNYLTSIQTKLIQEEQIKVQVVGEAISSLPNYFYSLRELGLEPSDEFADDFYYIQRGYYLLMNSYFMAMHNSNLLYKTGLVKSVALANNINSIFVLNETDKKSTDKIISEIRYDLDTVCEALQDILISFSRSQLMYQVLTGERKENISYWTINYFKSVVYAVQIVNNTFDPEPIRVPQKLAHIYQDVIRNEEQKNDEKTRSMVYY